MTTNRFGWQCRSLITQTMICQCPLQKVKEGWLIALSVPSWQVLLIITLLLVSVMKDQGREKKKCLLIPQHMKVKGSHLSLFLNSLFEGSMLAVIGQYSENSLGQTCAIETRMFGSIFTCFVPIFPPWFDYGVLRACFVPCDMRFSSAVKKYVQNRFNLRILDVSHQYVKSAVITR